MNNLTKISLVIACLSMSTGTHAGNDREHYRCTADGSRFVSSDRCREVESDCATFDASFEASPRAANTAGDLIAGYVAGTYEGSTTLVTPPNSDLALDLEFNPNSDEGNPFAGNFPTGVGSGTGTGLSGGKFGCSLVSKRQRAVME